MMHFEGFHLGLIKPDEPTTLLKSGNPFGAPILDFPPIFFWIISTHVKVSHMVWATFLKLSGLLRFWSFHLHGKSSLY